jgi:hypothetical protein
MTDDHKKDPKNQPADPKSVVAQQPPGQRHPQQNVDLEHTGSINEPPGSNTTPWYNPSERDAAQHKEAERKNYTPEEQRKRQEETAKAGKADHEESEARAKKAREEEEAERKQHK